MSILVWSTTDCAPLLRQAIVPFDSSRPLPPPHWRERTSVEEDPAWQQPIPYVVAIDGTDQPWVYQRSDGDAPLLVRRSVGLGGHVETCDHAGDPHPSHTPLSTLRKGMLRELDEELVEYPPRMASAARPLAWIHEHDSALGRVHLGLVFYFPWMLGLPPRPRDGEALRGLGFFPLAQARCMPGLETWSHLALQALETVP